MDDLQDLLAASQVRHTHLCPRQVLGVRVALAGLKLLNIDSITDRRKKSLIVISETDGCFVDGIEVTAQVSVGHRSLKIEDYGKIAATFVDVRNGQAVRMVYFVRRLHFTRYQIVTGVPQRQKWDTVCERLGWPRYLLENGLGANEKRGDGRRNS